VGEKIREKSLEEFFLNSLEISQKKLDRVSTSAHAGKEGNNSRQPNRLAKNTERWRLQSADQLESFAEASWVSGRPMVDRYMESVDR